jgi:hypothetical protein
MSGPQQKPPAAHVRAAIARHRPAPVAQSRIAPGPHRPLAAHVQAAVLQPAPGGRAPAPAPHVLAAMHRGAAPPAIQRADEERRWYGKPLKPDKAYPNLLVDKARLVPLHAESGYSKEYDAAHNVRYFSREEKKPLKVRGAAGNLMLTGTDGQVPMPDGVYLYAISPKGGLYVWKSGLGPALAEGEALQHSSLFAGERVQVAGYLDVANGTIYQIDGGSGHYKPNTPQVVHAVLGLLAAGLVTDDVDVKSHEMPDYRSLYALSNWGDDEFQESRVDL